ncbi:hypothetical protein Moror_14107 [Moniliophthora roreri MCA 2997]|uniref:Uncharacterized protein n=2 Tax=Moniliophthora roreri TaxID=221103 RepID=V2YT46_MONRO|nr:hypothetical protein Moror_14107 [Moniliophthora roreri MCA 2997]KAI3619858.1 hypothetical protein WG66_002755 [Moniliophthora roreri]
MFCIPFRALSPKPRLSSCELSDQNQEKTVTHTNNASANWAPHPHRMSRKSVAQGSLRRRRSSLTLAEEEETRSHSKPQERKLQSLKRQFVLAWKRINASSQPRASQRFSYMPPGFERAYASPPASEKPSQHRTREVWPWNGN